LYSSSTQDTVHTPYPTRRLRRLDPRAFGAGYTRPLG